MLGKIKPDSQQNLFKTRLTDLINLGHPLVKLTDEVSWDKMELEFQNLYSEQHNGTRKKLRTIGHRVVRELERKLPEHLQKQYETEFSNYKKALTQERNSKEKFTVCTNHKQLVLPREKHTRRMNLVQKCVL